MNLRHDGGPWEGPNLPRRIPLRRLVLGCLALAAIAAPPVSAGCAAGSEPISQVQGLRVIAVAPENDGSYVVPVAPNQPGCDATDASQCALPADASVTFDMSYEYTYGGPVEIVWLGGCVNPDGDEYYGCYPQLATLFADLEPYFQSGDPASIPPAALADLGFGSSFTMKLPSDLISSRPVTAGLPPYGIAFAFFLACAGHIGPAPAGDSASTGLAGSFPVGCYADAALTMPVGADRFVPGYTQVYAFAQGFTNKNPPVCNFSVTLNPGTGTGVADGGSSGDGGTGGGSSGDGGTGGGSCKADVPDGGDGSSGRQSFTAPYCDVSEAARNASGCKAVSTAGCATYNVTVEVPDTVADYDPANAVYETVWVDYFADQGDMDDPVLLIAASSPATAGPGPDGTYPPSPGLQPGQFSTNWTPPPPPAADAGTSAPQTATLWAVVHDSRGGSTVLKRQISLTASPDGG
jgi:hypothetical protein